MCLIFILSILHRKTCPSWCTFCVLNFRSDRLRTKKEQNLDPTHYTVVATLQSCTHDSADWQCKREHVWQMSLPECGSLRLRNRKGTEYSSTTLKYTVSCTFAAMASPSTLCFSWAHTLGGWSQGVRVNQFIPIYIPDHWTTPQRYRQLMLSPNVNCVP